LENFETREEFYASMSEDSAATSNPVVFYLEASSPPMSHTTLSDPEGGIALLIPHWPLRHLPIATACRRAMCLLSMIATTWEVFFFCLSGRQPRSYATMPSVVDAAVSPTSLGSSPLTFHAIEHAMQPELGSCTLLKQGI
jgi:hypothetical protein